MLARVRSRLSCRGADVSRAFASLQLAARIAVSNLHKNTLKSFSDTCVRLRLAFAALQWHD